MKNLLKYGYASAALLLVVTAVLALGGCNKRPYTRIAKMPLHIKLDWSGATADVVVPETLKLFLYAPDGKKEEYLIGKEGKVLELPVGTYKAICVNVNENVDVLYSDKFETAQMVAKKISANASYSGDFLSKAEGDIIYQPGWVFSYGMPEIKVGDPAITNAESSLSEVLFPMQKLVRVVNFRFTVSGLTSEITNVKGKLDNVASTIDLSTGKIVCGYQASSPFRLDYMEDGSLGGTMLIFGNEADENQDLKNNLHLEFETESGRTIDHEADITDQMTGGNVEGDLNINIDANIDVQFNAGLVTIVIDWKKGTEEDLEGI